jgi:hypothetical protein
VLDHLVRTPSRAMDSSHFLPEDALALSTVYYDYLHCQE